MIFLNTNNANKNGQNVQYPQSNQESHRRMLMMKQQQKRNRQRSDVIAKVLAVFGALALIGGVGLLVFGIIKGNDFLWSTIAGAALTGISILLFIIMAVVLCKSDSKPQQTRKVGSV